MLYRVINSTYLWNGSYNEEMYDFTEVSQTSVSAKMAAKRLWSELCYTKCVPKF